jgi:hypothetical protein
VPVFAPTGAPTRRRQNSRHRIDNILARRDQLVAEVALLRDGGEASKLIDNAQQLLTRWWSAASWNGREELLKTADWLVHIEKGRRNRAQTPA